jgi:hypothetical protein
MMGLHRTPNFNRWTPISIAGLLLAKQDVLGNEIVAQITKQVITIVAPTLNEAAGGLSFLGTV